MRHRFRYAAISILIASVPIVLTVLGRRESTEPGEIAEPLFEMIVYGIAQWYPWTIIAPFIDWRVRRSRPDRLIDRARTLAEHVLLWATFATAHGLLYQATVNAVSTMAIRELPRVSRQYWPDAILYTAIAGGFMIAESRRRQTEVAERLRAEVAEARLDALRQQLNPHFLFNTLNHIVMQLRTHHVEPAQRMLLALSDLLRDVLRERAQVIPLRDEVRIVERYLEIERERFGDRLQAQVTFEPKALDALVPSLILQPLLENAMRHGVSASDGCCRLVLTARIREQRLIIDVQDAGPGMETNASGDSPGVGLKNTSERLRYLYGSDHTFTLRTLEGGGLLVSLDLPFRRA